MEFQSRTQAIQISGIRKFSELVAKYPNALSLTIGQPHLPTPEHIRIAAQEAIAEGDTGYTPNRGTLALREAAAAYYRRLVGLDYDPATEILVTVGATHALDVAMRTLVQPGDEVIIPAPAYPGYEGIVKLLGARVVYVDTRQDGLLLTPEALRRAISPRTRMVILASPVNPTGVVYPFERLQALAEVLADTKVWVISDEIYCELQFAGHLQSVALLPGMRERTIVIHGLSKSHSMTGWRIGFAFAPAHVAAEMAKVVQYGVSCASSISQRAALAALTEGADDARPMRELYRNNRDLVVAAFTAMEIPLVRPDGAFYAFPAFALALGDTSENIAHRLLAEAGVAVVPGDAFSPYGEGHVRLSYACDPEMLREALRRIEAFVAKERRA
ncbi:putative N-acetyl-LL-diaminopimelate aminotransferase [Alicyclobacillus hesperidum subsp. aegles]|uniref:aminotransferase class I/II-fold pyridoxal phosphate-dependent enzyme n=1 Tax=Alicyclobacillus hesperidum TaxID=89784 RepID=UPI00222B4FB7|nr:aminotransferase class I/II-fold pyridoxal phosphate-dependent enzyme [Alicyclobacillus hesperidum]GLG01959.1 putative N-acetyl-LL-diaminopimelate aminotransferase [Alicyclobacillus hesperidum subsp. aegles]